MSLPEKDEHHLHAAEGWLDLDDAVAADQEIEQIDPENRGHPAVLLVRCRIYLETHRPDYTKTSVIIRIALP